MMVGLPNRYEKLVMWAFRRPLDVVRVSFGLRLVSQL